MEKTTIPVRFEVGQMINHLGQKAIVSSVRVAADGFHSYRIGPSMDVGIWWNEAHWWPIKGKIASNSDKE